MTKVRTPSGAARAWLEQNAQHEGAECLIFPFYRHPNGYGIVWADKMRRTGAHRLMCILAHGKPPTPSHEAAHSCGKGNEGCCNPNHLHWATRRENAKEAVGHGVRFNPSGRTPKQRGELHGRARLSDANVVRIRELIEAGRSTMKALAREYGVHPSTISLAVSGKNWSHIQAR